MIWWLLRVNKNQSLIQMHFLKSLIELYLFIPFIYMVFFIFTSYLYLWQVIVRDCFFLSEVGLLTTVKWRELTETDEKMLLCVLRLSSFYRVQLVYWCLLVQKDVDDLLLPSTLDFELFRVRSIYLRLGEVRIFLTLRNVQESFWKTNGCSLFSFYKWNRLDFLQNKC